MSGICLLYLAVGAAVVGTAPYRLNDRHDAYFFNIGATASFTLAHVAVDSAFQGQHLLGPGP